MIVRSVVGKLWVTIILLVSLVLILLSLFLNEKVEVTYLEDQENSLRSLTKEIQDNLNKMDHNCAFYLGNVIKTAKLFNTYTMILDHNGKTLSHTKTGSLSKFQWDDLLERPELEMVLQGKQLAEQRNDIFFLASPYYLHGKTQGVIILYQLQDQPTETDIKKWITYSALIGMVLTTIFAFFLSTRITQPLIQMKNAAEKMAKGELSIRVPVKTRQKDEIGNLSVTFNKMAEQLEDLIHQSSQEKEHLSSILRSMSDGVITFDKFGRVILTNPPGNLFLSLWDPLLPSGLLVLVKKVVDDNKEHLGDISEKGQTWSVVLAPLYAKEQVRGVVAVLREVTNERRLDKLRKDFVANVSHELRTPLSMLQGYSEALMDDIAESKEERYEIAQLINEESLRMGRLVSELLDFARMEAGHIVLNLSPVKVPEFTERIKRKFQAFARSEEIEVTFSVSEHAHPIFIDEDKIEQVLTNLIDNSIRHTPENGRVVVEAYQDDFFQYFRVKDSGVGISEEDLPYVFERFYKADKARTRSKSSGTGLGLAIVKHLVHAHKGRVTVQSRVGKGTQFLIHIPMNLPHLRQR